MPRCARCELHLRLCLCAELVPLALATRVVVLSSAKETRQATNTGRLVPLALAGGEVRILERGAGEGVVELGPLSPDQGHPARDGALEHDPDRGLLTPRERQAPAWL